MTDAARVRDAAVAFVAQRGTPLERAVAKALVGQQPATEALSLLSATQEPDGSFPAVPGSSGGIAGTLAALRILVDLGAANATAGEAACAWLRSAQSDDGSWSIGAGSEAERMDATGHLGGLLARTRFAHPLVIDAAGVYLDACWAPEKVRDPAWHVVAAYLHYFSNAVHELSDEILHRCGRELERGFRTGALDAVDLVRVFVDCDAHSLPGAQIDRDELLTTLASRQQADGGFGAQSAIGSGSAVGRALDVLVGLARLA